MSPADFYIDVSRMYSQYSSVNSTSVENASGGPPGRRLWSGPWLLVRPSTPGPHHIANKIHKQCVARGIEILEHSIDEIKQVHLNPFTGLVVVLPSQLANPPGALRLFARLIVEYRDLRPDGLESIINGSREWFNAGVVQIIGSRVIMQRPEMRAALDLACAQHDISSSDVFDVFRPYTRRFALTKQLDEQPAIGEGDPNIERLWQDIQTWGITDRRDVPKLLKCINNFRKHYEDKKFSQLYRPIQGLDKNRLDIILDGPHNVEIGDHKTWMENGARVCRDVLKELKKIVPELARPGGHGNGKDAQKQLLRLYRNLRIMEIAMRNKDK